MAGPATTAPPRPAAPMAGRAPAYIASTTKQGIVTVVAAVTGVPDLVRDVINPAAFARTLAIRRPKVAVNHQWDKFVGRVLKIAELMPGDPRLPKTTKDGKPWPVCAGALIATLQFNLNSFAGREAWSFVEFYTESNECEWSIGYKVVEGKTSKRRDGCRVIYDLDVYEISLVLLGAANQTMTLEIKGANNDELEWKTAALAADLPVLLRGGRSAMEAVLEAKALDTEVDPPGDASDDPTVDPNTPDGWDGPTHAGLAVVAKDTGRVCMLQRALDDDDPASGTWEFPGGGIDDDEDPADAAQREFSEETGLEVPDGEQYDTWDSPNGVYRGFILAIPSEADMPLNPDKAAVKNPDDPKRANPETTAWFDPDHLPDMPSLRPAVRNTPWDKIKAASGRDTTAKAAAKTQAKTETKSLRTALRTAAGVVLEAKSYSSDSKHARRGQVKHRCQFCGKPAAVHRAWTGGSYTACATHDAKYTVPTTSTTDPSADTSTSTSTPADQTTPPLEGKVVGGPHDTSPLGTPGGRQNWVDEAGGLPDYHREVAHALERDGHSETAAIRIAAGRINRWADGLDGASAETQAKAAAAKAQWDAKRVSSHSKHATTAVAHTKGN